MADEPLNPAESTPEVPDTSSEAAEQPVASESSEEPSSEPATPEESHDYKAERDSLQEALRIEREKNRLKKREERLAEESSATITPDEDGAIDPEQLIVAAENRALSKLRLEQFQAEQRREAMEKYPELKDQDLLDMVEDRRIRMMSQSGEYVSYDEAASKVLSKFKAQTETAKSEARREAEVSERVQDRATVTPPSSQGAQKDEIAELRKIIRTGSRKEADAALVKLTSLQYSNQE